MNKILSIIVPSYNVEKYLEQNLNSMCLSAAINDLEIIIVNDGSRDHTIDIANKFKSNFSNSVVVIDKENGGHGSTINAGVAVATGKYFKVIDGDDWVDTNELTKLIHKLKNTDVDLVLSPFKKVYEDIHKEEIISLEMSFNSQNSSFSNSIADIDDFYCLHSSTFKTELYRKRNLFIREHCFYVDMELILYPIDYIRTYEYINHCVYQYRLGRPGQSVSMISKIKNKDMHLNVIKDLIENCLQKHSTRREPLIQQYLEKKICTLANIQYSIYLSMPPDTKTYKELKKFRDDFERTIPTDFLKGISKIMHYLPISYWLLGYRYRNRYLK